MIGRHHLRRAGVAIPWSQRTLQPLRWTRLKRYDAFDATLDKEALAEARTWFQSFDMSQLPKGSTTYARSSGPGGQHVNKYGNKNH